MMKSFRFVLSVIILAGIFGFSAKGVEPEQSNPDPEKTLYKLGMEYLEKQQYEKARQALQTLISTYPSSDLVPSSHLALGDSFYNEESADNIHIAEKYYRTFVDFYPAHPQAAKVQMKIISINMKRLHKPGSDQQDSLKAMREIKKLINRYPNSDYVSDAKQLLAEVQKNLGKVERIDIRGNRRIPQETVHFYIHSKPGEYYDEAQLESDLYALYKTGFYERVELQENDGDAGRIITFILKEKPIVRSIEFTGNKSFTEADICAAFKRNKIDLAVNSNYDSSSIKAAEEVLRELMVKNGKPLGSILAQVENIPPSSVLVRFVFDEEAKVLP
jgi:outer membrane assembly lipoprotein YfiO